MSATTQNNPSKGKTGSSSSNSSMVNTPASTPVSTMANGQANTQTSPPPNNAPKYGTLVPNRIFVGGISASTTEGELLQLFSNYGTVKAAKIIQDRAGVSKGYGFITFESEDDAKRLQRESDNIVLRERKLNIAPAIKKQSLQPFSRAFDASSPPAVAAGNPAQYFFQPGAMPYFQGGVAYYPQPPTGPADPAAQPQAAVYPAPSVYPPQTAPPQSAAYPPVMFPAQPIYMPQQYPMPIPYDYSYYAAANGGAQFVVGGQGGPQSQLPPMQRPNSPPRPNCYGQQMPYNNPPDAVYYNMPAIYGPVDGPMYDAAGMDMSMPNGTLHEEFSIEDRCAIASETNSPAPNQMRPIHLNKDAAVEHSLKQPPDVCERQSNTPVVSLLSIDQHQEKDLMSMQSGRRRKSPPVLAVLSSSPPPLHCMSNGFTGCPSFTSPPSYGGAYVSSQPPPYNYTHSFNNSTSTHTPPAAAVNGFDKSFWTSRKWPRHGGGGGGCDASSIRTDSNSSASVVDENRNEEKFFVNDFMTTTGTLYNPSTRLIPSRSFQSNVRYGRGSFDSRRGVSRTNASNRDFSFNRTKDVPQPFVPNCTFHNKPTPSPPSQMHPGNQHFVPPSRRTRNRTVRRNGSTALSEIGAGDAPLPSADVSEACNKLDSLKL